MISEIWLNITCPICYPSILLSFQFEEVSKLKECTNLQDCLFLSVFKLKQSKEWGKDLGEARFMRHIMAVLYWEQYCILEQCVTLVEQSRRAKAFEKSPAGCHKQCAEDTRTDCDEINFEGSFFILQSDYARKKVWQHGITLVGICLQPKKSCLTVPIDRILNVQNARAWVSMDFT